MTKNAKTICLLYRYNDTPVAAVAVVNNAVVTVINVVEVANVATVAFVNVAAVAVDDVAALIKVAELTDYLPWLVSSKQF